MMRRMVDLPVPLGPMMPTASPRRTTRLAPASTWRLPNDLCTSTSSMRTSSSVQCGGSGPSS